MKLNLGCFDRIMDGYVNVDIVPGADIEVVDLRLPWPWPDSSISHVVAHHIIEHLPDKIHTMNELWRVLESGGKADIIVPTTDGPGAWQDPTHVSYWNRRAFIYFEHGHSYHNRIADHYGIKADFKVVAEEERRTQDGVLLDITLRAVKGYL